MSTHFKHLFEPFRFRTFETKNRLVMPPMAIYIPGCNGFVGDRLVDYYEARAKGGAGFIIFNATHVHPNGASHPNMTSIMDDKFIPGLLRVVEAVHAHGVPMVIQLYHAGRQRYALIAGGQTLSPSGISDPVRKDPAKAPTIEEIQSLVEDYGQAARRAREAGFEGVELHCAHGYLLSGFLSPYQNKRTDEYGGDVWGRTRIVREILARCRERGGKDMLIGVRLNGSDYINGGNTNEDAKAIAKILAEAGSEYIHVSAGMAPSAQYSFLPAAIPQGFNVHLAEGIKEAVGEVPVIACGAIEDPTFAEEILARGKVDLVALGRPLFADPELPNKAKEGRLKEIRPCLRCSKGAAVWPEDMRCVVNAAVGKERVFEEKLVPSGAPKKVLVIGAGPGGLEAARIAAIRGHKVTVMDKGQQIGGKIHIAKRVPDKANQEKWLAYFENEMQRLGVKLELGREASVADVEKANPDVVIVATGGEPLIPKSIAGTELLGVVVSDDVLLEKVSVGRKVAIVGGSSSGVETAEYILEKGDHEVVVVEQLPHILSDISHDAELALIDKLVDKNFRFVEDARVMVIAARNGKLDLKIQRFSLDHTLKGFDTVILAVGVTPNNQLGLELKKKRKNVYLVGDCEGAGDYRKAVHDGAGIALEI